jgi:HAD superfamily phosphoserine phosphatase-like hydrolase
MNQKKCKGLAVLDFDGTLSKGFISMGFLDYLAKLEVYSSECYKEQMRILSDYKAGRLHYEKWCYQWGQLWAKGLKGRSVRTVNKCAAKFFKSFRKNIYFDSYKVIRLLKNNNYKVVILTMAAKEMISLAAKDFGADIFFSTEVESKKGVYTGRLLTDIHVPGGKEESLRKLLQRGDYQKTIGFGDSKSDVEFMKLLDLRIAFNPVPEMKMFCKKYKWDIIYLDGKRNAVGKVKKIIS